MDQIRVELGDSNYPFSGGSGGSTTAASVSPAIRVTAGMARDELFERIAPALKTTADQLELGVGRVTVARAGAAARTISWRDACKLLGAQPVSVDGQWERGLSASGTTGVQFADVEVDIETGVTRVQQDRLRPGLRVDRRPQDGRDAVLRRDHQRARITPCSRSASSTATRRTW